MFAVYIILIYQYKFNNTDRRYGNLVGGLNLSRSPWEQVGLSHKTEKKKKKVHQLFLRELWSGKLLFQVFSVILPILEGGLIAEVSHTNVNAKLLQSCPTLCDPTDGSPPGSPVPGILQARTLEWVAISFSNAWKRRVKVKSLHKLWLWMTS